jgi:hypothetical protein
VGFNGWIRQLHRWISMIFVLIAGGIFVALGMAQQPPQWVYFVPLIPLAFLVFTGLYLFALPYFIRARRG